MKRIIPFVRSFCAFAALFLMLSSGAASAQVIASDFFSYTPGINNLQGNNGGAGWAAAWLAPGSSSDSASVQAAASPLDFVPLGGADINGGATSVNCYGTASASAAARQLATPLTSTFYVRFLVQYNNTNVPPLNNFNGSDTFALHFSDTASDTSTLNFGLRFSEVSTFMTRNGTGTPVTGAFITNSFQAGATHLMVAQVVNSGGVFNHINGWLDPSYGSSNAPTITLSAGTLSAINYLFFRVAANESDDRYLIDNLLVGQTWNDVVPPGAPPVVLISVETAANGSGTVVPAQNITAGNVPVQHPRDLVGAKRHRRRRERRSGPFRQWHERCLYWTSGRLCERHGLGRRRRRDSFGRIERRDRFREPNTRGDEAGRKRRNCPSAVHRIG